MRRQKAKKKVMCSCLETIRTRIQKRKPRMLFMGRVELVATEILSWGTMERERVVYRLEEYPMRKIGRMRMIGRESEAIQGARAVA